MLSVAVVVDDVTERALDGVCARLSASDRVRCRAVQRERVEKAVRVIMGTCGRLGLPERVCGALAVTAGHETRLLAYPTRRAPEICVKRCGALPRGWSRRCRIECTAEVDPSAVSRVLRANDGGTSAGFFQIKIGGAVERACRRQLGAFNAHDLALATRCYALTVKRAFERLPRRCRGGDEWSKALHRAGAGWKRAGCLPSAYLRSRDLQRLRR